MTTVILTTTTDNTGWNAATSVYGEELRHLLCHWHVDRYMYTSEYEVGELFVITTTCSYVPERSWKNHLRGVNDENKIPIYQALGILFQETLIEVFTDLLDKFQSYWSEREPGFVTYFKEHYASRPGTCMVDIILAIDYKCLVHRKVG